MKIRNNAGTLGPKNTPSTASATGVWSVQELYQNQRDGTWPTAVDPTGDLNYNQTTLLLHGDGTNGAQNNTFLDGSTNAFTITRNGNATQGTFSPFSQPDGYWSNYFDGSSALTYASASPAIGTGDFAFEMWFYPTSSSGTMNPFQIGGITSGAFEVMYNRTAEGQTNYLICLNVYGGGRIDSSTPIPQNQWTHVAITRSSGTCRIFINGILDKSASLTDNFSASGNMAVGREGTYNGGYVTGYISNLRLVVGSAVYTASFTPSTSPLTAVSGTALLTCQSNRFKDNSTNAYVWSVVSAPQVQVFSPFGGTSAYSSSTNGGSGYFDGSGDYLTAASNAAFNFGSGDATIEGWVYPTTSGQNSTITDKRSNAGNYSQFPQLSLVSGALYVYVSYDGSSWPVQITGSTLQVNAWSHFALVRSGNTWTLYINGAVSGTPVTASGSVYTGSSSLSIGSATDGGSTVFTGYISNIRLLKGTAQYTSAFTPPTAPLTAITNTSLLLSGTNAGIIDNTQTNDLETVGNAQISTTQKKFGSSSMYFDGSSYASLLNNPVGTTGDFTVEGWFYSSTATTAFQVLFEFGGNSNQNSLGTVALALGGPNGGDAGSTVTMFAATSGSAGWAVQVLSPSGVISNNTWHHFAVVRSGGTFTTYINGNAVCTSTSVAATTALYSGTLHWVGSLTYPGYRFSGYLDDFRVTKGIARYLYNFIPPTKAFPDYGRIAASPSTDNYFGSTPLLLHGDGSSGTQNQTFLDSSTNAFTITRNGNTTQGTFTPFSRAEGYWSNYFNGSSDYLSVANNAALNLGTGDFTIEAWIYPISVNSGNANPVISQLTGSSNTGWLFGISSTSLWQFSTGSSVIVRAGNVALNQWTHLAAVRISGTTTLYVNGSSVGSTSSSFNFSDTASLLIGYQSSFVYTNCYVSNARIIKGTGAYTSNFTPSTLPLTAITNTSILTCQSNRFKDNSTNAFAITTSGSPQVQTLTPFEPTTAYSAVTNGGSAYFDGSGDTLQVAYGSGQMNLTNQDFAIEFWAYLPSSLQNKSFLCQDQNYYQLNFNIDSSFRLIVYSYQSQASGGAENFALNLGTIPQGQWVHFALTRTGSTVAGYVNGVRGATASYSGTITAQTGGWYIGAAYGGNAPFTGYMSNVRFVIGSNPYGVGTTLTVPTAPLTAVSNTQFLCNFTNAGIIDNAASTIFETVGTAQVSTTQYKYGTGSMYFNGSSYLKAPYSKNFVFEKDFTVEFWLYFTAHGNYGGLVSGATSPSTATGWQILWNGTSNNLRYESTDGDIVSSSTVSTSTWTHIAVTRLNGKVTMYINGLNNGTLSSTSSLDSGSYPLYVGVERTAVAYTTGYIDDLRITKGICRYPYNFQPPTSAYPDY